VTKLLYIAGVPHSGTTILSQILEGVDGLAVVGESFYLWDAYDKGWACGCGEPLRACPFWAPALVDAFADGNRTIADLRPDRYYMSMRELPRVLRGGSPAAYRGALAATLHGVAATAGARVVVDASKSPTYGRILEMLPDVDFHVLHLVRRPQATAHSWARFPGEAGRPVRHASVWTSWNVLVELLWARRGDRYLRIRYEDFAARPRETVREIVEFVGEAVDALPFATDGNAELAVAHTVAGNPVRFRSGSVPIVLDEAWRTTLPARDAQVLETLSWPLRQHYGYRSRERR
jgi:hypothetical protein